jgi:asparagine synthase (glutamine-hydrolysing)
MLRRFTTSHFGNSSALPAFYCAKLAHDEGVTRMLAGDAATSFSAATRAMRPIEFSPHTSEFPTS